MKNSHVLALLAVLGLFQTHASASAPRPAPSAVYVTVYRRDGPGQVNYQFYLQNGSSRLVSRLQIGLDPRDGHQELRSAPMRWRAGERTPSSVASPQGWNCRIVPRSGNDRFHLEWKAGKANELAGTSEFVVALARRDSSYENAHWVVVAQGRTYSGVVRTMNDYGKVVGLNARDSLEQKVRDFVLHPTFDSPDPHPLTFGPTARPVLLAMLEDTDFDHHRSQILRLLGFVGDSRDTPLLESYVLSRYSGELDEWSRGAILGALDGVGRLSSRDPKALDFLRQAANPDFFRGIRYQDHYRDQAKLRLMLSGLAIHALARSTSPEAGRLLAELEKDPYDTSQVEYIKEAIARRANGGRSSRPTEIPQRR